MPRKRLAPAPASGSLADQAQGLSLDALVAERLFRWMNVSSDFKGGLDGQPLDAKGYLEPVPRYSTDGNAMLLVLEGMRQRGYSIHFAYLLCGVCCASFVAQEKVNQNDAPAGCHEGNSLPEVVCRAALKAIYSEQVNNPPDRSEGCGRGTGSISDQQNRL